MKRQKIIKFIPFGIAMLLVLISIFQAFKIPNTINDKGETVLYLVSDSILYALFGLIIVFIFFILRKNYWKHIFAIVLVYALTPIVQFYTMSLSFGIGFINIDLIALALLTFHLLVNKEVLRDTLNLFTTSDVRKEENKERQIANFQKKFASKDQRELEKIVDEKFLKPEAVEAARRLLQEK